MDYLVRSKKLGCNVYTHWLKKIILEEAIWKIPHQHLRISIQIWTQSITQYKLPVEVNASFQTHLVRKKCPCSELLWSAFLLRTLRFQSECGKMRSSVTLNTDTYYGVTYIDLILANFLKSSQTIETGLSDFHKVTLTDSKIHFPRLKQKLSVTDTIKVL